MVNTAFCGPLQQHKKGEHASDTYRRNYGLNFVDTAAILRPQKQITAFYYLVDTAIVWIASVYCSLVYGGVFTPEITLVTAKAVVIVCSSRGEYRSFCSSTRQFHLVFHDLSAAARRLFQVPFNLSGWLDIVYS